jgi:hypothetical protein
LSVGLRGDGVGSVGSVAIIGASGAAGIGSDMTAAASGGGGTTSACGSNVGVSGGGGISGCSVGAEGEVVSDFGSWG